MSEEVDRVDRIIDEITHPRRMTGADAIQFLEELASLIDGKIDDLREDIENEREEDDDA